MYAEPQIIEHSDVLSGFNQDWNLCTMLWRTKFREAMPTDGMRVIRNIKGSIRIMNDWVESALHNSFAYIL